MTTKNITLDDWQKRLLDIEDNMVLCTGRQVGKTTIMSIKSAEYMIQHPNSRIIIVSLTEDQAKLIIVMILDYLEKNYKKMIAKGKNKPTQNKVMLINGSSALARPVGTTGDAIRGFTGDILIIDEASRMPEMVWTASKPTLLTTAGKIWMCSTPHGKRGYFWEAFQNKHGRFEVFHINSEDVIKNRKVNDVWTETKRNEAIRFLEEERRDMSELQYGQEYLGLFLDELRQYFDDKTIERATILKRPENNLTNQEKYMGVDIARLGGDECAYEILTRRETIIHHIESITRKNQLTTKTEQDILELDTKWNLGKIGIDAGSGSLGVGIFDHLIESRIKKKVIAMNNREISMDREGKKKQRIFKEDMYDNLRSMLEKGEIYLLDDDKVRLSLKSIQWEFYNPNDAEKGITTKMRIFGSYSHITEALVRAAWLAKKEKINKLRISYI